jgi:predicted dehydrogenase
MISRPTAGQPETEQRLRIEPIRIGALGAGGFGLFALQQFMQVPGVQLAAMGATHREAALAMTRRFGIPAVDGDELLASKDINLIYIATPPFLHYAQAMKALRAGKHVICEKPLAMNTTEADEMIRMAREEGLLLVANLMQRYNGLFESVRRLVETRVLGEFLHGYFENYASDEGLGADHWFWDRERSGGIFIEHGVHFFDLFTGWLGCGEVVSAQRNVRPGTDIEEQVSCTVRYPGGGLVNFYHGFTQPSRIDRQEFRLLFERGDVTLEEWVPVRARVRAIADEDQTRRLLELFPGARLDVSNTYAGKDRAAFGRHKALDIFQTIEISYDHGSKKLHCYGDLLRRLLEDQMHWIHDRNHRRTVTEENGRDSLAMAVEADRLAHL